MVTTFSDYQLNKTYSCLKNVYNDTMLKTFEPLEGSKEPYSKVKTRSSPSNLIP